MRDLYQEPGADSVLLSTGIKQASHYTKSCLAVVLNVCGFYS